MRVKKLFRPPPPPIQARSRKIVEKQISRAGADPDLTSIVAADQGIEVDEVTDDFERRERDLLKRLKPLLESWERIDSQLRDALDQREQVTPKTPTLQLVAGPLLVLIWAIAILFLLLGLPSDLLPWNWSSNLLEFEAEEVPDPRTWARGLVLVGILYLPLHGTLGSREAREEGLGIPELEDARDLAEERFAFAAENLAPVLIRGSINARLASFSTEYRLLDHSGLRALADPQREVSTLASEELSNLIASLSSGSIGLSGPRGVGKTTLIESFACGRSMPLERERLGLVVSAPVKYDAKEFVLHLFASLCERVIDPDRLAYLQARDRVSFQDRRRARLVGVLGLLTVLVFGVAIAMLVFNKTLPEGPEETAYVLLAAGGLMAVGWRLLAVRPEIDWDGLGFGWLPRVLLGPPGRLPASPSERRALRLLEQIRFQQTVSSNISGSARLPLGLSVGAESSVTTARVPWSLPEAVDEFRSYAASLTETRYLVIGIDELDKMRSDASAKEFLDNVKGVFGVSGCYYLVSVSDDAMASFERRGMPVRDVFDSSFDAVQRVGYLTLEESRAVLESRVVGLPIPYQCLCHCLAGGLPRDLIRVTRELVQQAQQRAWLTSLEHLTQALAGVELRAKTAAAIEKLRESTETDTEQVQRWLDTQSSVSSEAHALERSVGRLELGSATNPPGGAELAFEVATFAYYAATLLELFQDDSPLLGLLQVPRTIEIGPRGFELLEALARARQQFAIGSGLTWQTIVEVREAMGLELWGDPRSVGGPRFRGSTAVDHRAPSPQPD